jgi:hypothetical protein
VFAVVLTVDVLSAVSLNDVAYVVSEEDDAIAMSVEHPSESAPRKDGGLSILVRSVISISSTTNAVL